MTTAIFRATATGHGIAFRHFVLPAARRALRGWERRRTHSSLASLSDRQLKDLGIHRSEIGSYARWLSEHDGRRR